MTEKPAQFLLKNEYRILGLMLFSLLGAMLTGQNALLEKSFLIIHFGFFLLWQPVFKQQHTFRLGGLIFLLLLILAYLYWFNPWLNALWVLLLLSLLTGRIFNHGFERAVYGYAVIILFLQLVLFLTPALFGLTGFSPTFQATAGSILLFSPLLLIFTPSRRESTRNVDFIRGFLVVLLTIFLCMGSVLVSFTTDQAYIPSLISSIIILSIFLIITSLLWAPPGGVAGLARLWEKYLLNIGGPFEQWINHIATEEARTANHPVAFLDASLQYLIQQHWVCGVYWQTTSATHHINHHLEGKKSRYPIVHHDDKIEIIIYTFAPIGPALSIHARLILRVLVFYYRAKLQEQQIIKQAHLQAIYETGSKLTHDVKNILQSTQTMIQIVNDNEAELEEKFSVLKKLLPVLNQRLQSTLSKLQSPHTVAQHAATTTGSLSDWWQQLQLRYINTGIMFSGHISNDNNVPVETFNTVAENLIENAKNKKSRETQITITVRLQQSDQGVVFQVCDSGSPFPAQKLTSLFHEALISEDGYGVGLYQSYQLADKTGYQLVLRENQPGKVCFTLCEKK